MWDEPNVKVKVPNFILFFFILYIKKEKMGSFLDTIKGVAWSRQKDGGHGSRNPLRSV